VCFPKTYKICHDQDISVQIAGEADCNFSYRRCFGAAEMDEWRELMAKLKGVQLSDEDDGVIWKLEQSGKISTRSVYLAHHFWRGGVIDTRMMEIWNTKIPMKVQFFLWMAWHNRI
jgi:hypothetical protein